MPPNTEVFTLSYHYERHRELALEVEGGEFTAREEINIIDLGLIAPDGSQVGVSGSNKTEIEISETYATPGYKPCPLIPGEWRILIGAYKVAAGGVEVIYELTFKPKELRLYRGDLHNHTIASDGVHNVEELAHRAVRHGLDYLAITDHNQMISTESMPHIPGVTLIPGIEWTHFKGHATFLGVDKPYDEPFFANDFEQVQAKFHTARDCRALIIISHPFDELCPFKFDMNALPFDCLEVWNGPMRESNLRAVGLWQKLLTEGKKIPICGGSDYHRDKLFIYPGGPTTCVYAMSGSPADILSGLKNGHAYISFAPDGPSLLMAAGDGIMGDNVPFSTVKEVQIEVDGLLTGDLIQLVDKEGNIPLLEVETDGKFKGSYTVGKPGFIRLEVLRGFVPGLPLLPALISNPIYFS
jgi:hypothetical protein